ncbi:MAG: hypothetical protein M0Q90_14180 [Bacteroidales bacterium]|nr:hypothetical protein [Bacteroidales bacterium]
MTKNRTEQIIADALALPAEDRINLLHKLQVSHPEQVKPKPAAGKAIFCDFFTEKYGTSYYWDVKDYVALNALLNKIKRKYAEQQRQIDNEIILEGFKHFLNAVYALKNEFYNANFTMSILNSKFNEIYIAISGKKQGKISNDYKSRILNDLQS